MVFPLLFLLFFVVVVVVFMLGILLISTVFLSPLPSLTLLLAYHKVTIFIIACQNWVVWIDSYKTFSSSWKFLFKALLMYNKFIFFLFSNIGYSYSIIYHAFIFSLVSTFKTKLQ